MVTRRSTMLLSERPQTTSTYDNSSSGRCALANMISQPNSIVAQPGDIVTFQFYPTRHSVIKAAYGYPCVPYDYIDNGGDMFYSGWMPVTDITDNVRIPLYIESKNLMLTTLQPPTWNLTVNDTSPVFYYCGAPGSCIDWGMVGVINANSSTSISTQISLAREASYQLIPGEPFPNEKQQASLAKLAHTATTATLTVTATGASSSESGEYGSGGNHSSDNSGGAGLSTGAIAGIAVGAAVVGIGAAALAFLLCRTRALKRKLDEQREQPPTAQQYPTSPFSPTQSQYYDQSRHTSGLPPYQGFAAAETLKPQDLVSERSSTGSPMPTPYQMQGHFAPFQPGVTDPRFTQ